MTGHIIPSLTWLRSEKRNKERLCAKRAPQKSAGASYYQWPKCPSLSLHPESFADFPAAHSEASPDRDALSWRASCPPSPALAHRWGIDIALLGTGDSACYSRIRSRAQYCRLMLRLATLNQSRSRRRWLHRRLRSSHREPNLRRRALSPAKLLPQQEKTRREEKRRCEASSPASLLVMVKLRPWHAWRWQQQPCPLYLLPLLVSPSSHSHSCSATTGPLLKISRQSGSARARNAVETAHDLFELEMRRRFNCQNRNSELVSCLSQSSASARARSLLTIVSLTQYWRVDN